MSLSKKTGDYFKANKLVLATAESCTAGLIASTVAQTSGSSGWLDAGFVVYSPQAKNTSLGVNLQTIEKYNITSEEVAREMALGALDHSLANISIATTGVAGPNGGTEDIPVGTVCFAWGFKKPDGLIVFSEKKVFPGSRNQIRKAAASYALIQSMYYHKTRITK